MPRSAHPCPSRHGKRQPTEDPRLRLQGAHPPMLFPEGRGSGAGRGSKDRAQPGSADRGASGRGQKGETHRPELWGSLLCAHRRQNGKPKGTKGTLLSPHQPARRGTLKSLPQRQSRAGLHPQAAALWRALATGPRAPAPTCHCRLLSALLHGSLPLLPTSLAQLKCHLPLEACWPSRSWGQPPLNPAISHTPSS